MGKILITSSSNSSPGVSAAQNTQAQSSGVLSPLADLANYADDYQNDPEWTSSQTHRDGHDLGEHGFQEYPSHDEGGYLEDPSQLNYHEPVDVCLLEKYNRLVPPLAATITHHGELTGIGGNTDTGTDFVLQQFNKTSLINGPENLPLVADAPGGTSTSATWESLIWCNESSDGILCWPETPAGEVALLPCSFQLNGVRYDTSGTATRVCDSMGIWLKSDYAHCIAETTPQGTEYDPGSLQITTTVFLCGYSLSLLFLFIAFIIFISFKELYCLRNKIHTQLILTYIFADALWIVTNVTGFKASMGGAGHVSCITFILLHYFHVTNFFWMFVEGLYLYILVVQTFIADNIKLRTYSLIGWGTPLLILFIWSIAKWMTQYEIDRQALIVNTNDPEFPLPSCPWLNISDYDWIYKAPVIFVLAGNIVFLFQIMWVLITKLRSAMNPETQQSRKAAKALLVLMPLLGITYLLILSGSKQTPIYEHIRALLISTQGSLVALLYCFCNAEVRTALRHRWSRLQEWCASFACCGCEFDGLQNVQQMRDSSPRSRTESIKLYTPNLHEFRKRESSGVSDITTMSTLRGSLNGSPNLTHTMAVYNKNNSRTTSVQLANNGNTHSHPQPPLSPWSSLRGSQHSRHSSSNNNSTVV